jgi:hypothetical protein
MLLRSVLIWLALALCTSAYANKGDDFGLVVDPPQFGNTQTELAPEASGYWRPTNSVGFKLSLTVGYYFANTTWGGQVCGAHMKAIVALPRVPGTTSDVIYAEAELFNPSGLGATFNTPYNLLTSRYGYRGSIRFDSYDPFTDQLTVTVSTNTGTNGTYTLVRDLGPLIGPRSPCE